MNITDRIIHCIIGILIGICFSVVVNTDGLKKGYINKKGLFIASNSVRDAQNVWNKMLASSMEATQRYESDFSVNTNRNVVIQSLFDDKEKNSVNIAYRNRQLSGEYILEFENPVDRNNLNHRIGQAASICAFNNRSNLNWLFAEFGFTLEMSEQCQTHLMKIHEASLEAEASICQLLKARSEYDDKIRSKMSLNQYNQYRQYDSLNNVRLELEKIRKYASQQKVLINDRDYASINGLLQHNKAFTEKAWYGPYDEIPNPIYGKDEVLRHCEKQLNDIQQKMHCALEQSANYGVSESGSNLLHAYYITIVENMKQWREKTEHPEQNIQLMVEMAQKLRQRYNDSRSLNTQENGIDPR